MQMTEALERAAELHPKRIAVRFGPRQHTFAALRERVARLAAALQTLGMRPGDRVAILALNSDRYLECQMAIPWGGGVCNPCNTRWSPAEIVYSLNDSGSTLLLADDHFAHLAMTLRRDSPALRHLIHCGDGPTPEAMHSYEALVNRSEPSGDAGRRGDDLLALLYTGGTTGFPKGVMLSHTNILSCGLSLHGEGVAAPNGTYLHAAPLFHIADLGCAVAHWIECNSHSIIPSFNPEATLRCIERDRVTCTLLVPTMIQMLIDHPAAKGAHDLSSLQTILYGGSPICEAVLERAMTTLPGVDFVQAYGMTELSPVATINPAWYHTPAARKHGKLRSAGRAISCTEVRIVDADDHELPRGTVGEVIVRGPNVMRGYWNKPDLTAQALREGWMHTGDGGWMDADGFLFIADRLKDMIVSGGENVYSAEVEDILARYSGVAACAVIGIPSEQWGESVHAVVVPQAGHRINIPELIEHCRRHIAHYKCPRSVEFAEALPMSGAGKVLKTVLREPHWRGRGRGVAQ